MHMLGLLEIFPITLKPLKTHFLEDELSRTPNDEAAVDDV